MVCSINLASVSLNSYFASYQRARLTSFLPFLFRVPLWIVTATETVLIHF